MDGEFVFLAVLGSQRPPLTLKSILLSIRVTDGSRAAARNGRREKQKR